MLADDGFHAVFFGKFQRVILEMDLDDRAAFWLFAVCGFNRKGSKAVACPDMGFGFALAKGRPRNYLDLVRDHEDGILVENGNVQRLAEAIIYLIEHEEERRAYGLRAAENVKRFLPDRVMPRWVALFEGLVK